MRTTCPAHLVMVSWTLCSSHRCIGLSSSGAHLMVKLVTRFCLVLTLRTRGACPPLDMNNLVKRSWMTLVWQMFRISPSLEVSVSTYFESNACPLPLASVVCPLCLFVSHLQWAHRNYESSSSRSAHQPRGVIPESSIAICIVFFILVAWQN
jgi:hypothetical protein